MYYQNHYYEVEYLDGQSHHTANLCVFVQGERNRGCHLAYIPQDATHPEDVHSFCSDLIFQVSASF